MFKACHTMQPGKILNAEYTIYPLYDAVLYGNTIDTEKFSKRLSCAIRHLPIRVKFSYEYDIQKAVENGIAKDPSLILNGEIFIEGLVQAEEISKRFETLLASPDIEV